MDNNDTPSLAEDGQVSTLFAGAGTKLAFMQPGDDILDRQLKEAHQLPTWNSRTDKNFSFVEFDYDNIFASPENVAYILRDATGNMEAHWIQDIQKDKELLEKVRTRKLIVDYVELVEGDPA